MLQDAPEPRQLRGSAPERSQPLSALLPCEPEPWRVFAGVPGAASAWFVPGQAVMQTERHRRAAVRAQGEF